MTAYEKREAGRRWAAQQRSYVTPAVITMILYCVFWLPGAIANIAYWQAASMDEHIAGTAPHGKGCLSVMLWLFVIIPVGLVGTLFLISLLAGAVGGTR